ncbi:MAG TPA: response regulator transcription factor [Actinomycetota bacterium]|nr:response regulator transcription factor [Actinomycetota bacterium]
MNTPKTRGLRPGVLLVDDEEEERGLLSELLDTERVSVVGQASDGLEGVELARALKPDVVLMDLRMPRLGGFEATRIINEELPFTQVIILTAYEGPLPERSAEEAGAYAYLVKGCAVEFIRDMIVQAWHYKAGLEERAAQAQQI